MNRTLLGACCLMIAMSAPAFTVTPERPSSTARARVRPTTPCLLAVYAEMNGVAPRASLEAVLTMRPSPFRRRSSTQARASRAPGLR